MTQENKINIAELLKDCPSGMELDCTKYSNVYFVGIDNYKKEPKIKLKIETFGTWCSELTLDKYGKESSHPNAKCMIFPKGKTTWEGFQRPFKDGDIAISDIGDIHLLQTSSSSYCAYRESWEILPKFDCTLTTNVTIVRFATEEEKEKLFQAIKDNGYRWNAETKTLEKLIEPKFKVGDKIKHINGKNKDGVKEGIILSITDDTYDVAVTNDMGIFVSIVEQDNWELAPNKFDINTLKPFDKVLARCSSLEKWHIQFFEKYNTESSAKYPFICLCNNKYCQCIPYERNEHLLGTTNDCDEYYKTWK